MSPRRDHLASTSREGPSVYRWTLTLFGRVDGQSGTTLSGAEESTDYPLYFSHDSRYLVQNAAVWDRENIFAQDPSCTTRPPRASATR